MMANNEPMSDGQLAELLEKAAKPWRPRDFPAELMCRITTRQAWHLASLSLELAVDNERLRAREAALEAVVRAVGEADNSDNSVCYQVCDYSVHGDWMIEHESPCVVKQARALLAASTDATTAERE